MGALAENYKIALGVGDRLIDLLRPPVALNHVDEILALVDQHEAVVSRGMDLIAAGADSAGAEEVLERLIVQERELQQLLAGALNQLGRELAESRRVQGTLRSFQRLLNPGSVSRRLNELR